MDLQLINLINELNNIYLNIVLKTEILTANRTKENPSESIHNDCSEYIRTGRARIESINKKLKSELTYQPANTTEPFPEILLRQAL